MVGRWIGSRKGGSGVIFDCIKVVWGLNGEWVYLDVPRLGYIESLLLFSIGLSRVYLWRQQYPARWSWCAGIGSGAGALSRGKHTLLPAPPLPCSSRNEGVGCAKWFLFLFIFPSFQWGEEEEEENLRSARHANRVGLSLPPVTCGPQKGPQKGNPISFSIVSLVKSALLDPIDHLTLV